MSFWQDLEEMQKEIENLDTQSGSKANSKGNSKVNSKINSRKNSVANSSDERLSKSNSIQRARISELEEKAKALSQMISKQTTKKTTTKTFIQSPTYSKNIALCVKDATKSHDANVQLMHHLAALEAEIKSLTQKEDVWHDTAKVIQEEVSSLRAQINSMKAQQKSSSNTRSATYSKDTRDSRNLRKGSRDTYKENRRKLRDDRSRVETITERTERTERTEYSRRDAQRDAAREAREAREASLDRRISIKTPEPVKVTASTYQTRPEPINTRSEFETKTVIKETRTETDNNNNNNINVYQYKRLERANKQLSSDYDRLHQDYQRSIDKFTTEKQELNAKLAAKDAQIDKLQHNLQNTDYRVGEERSKCNDLQQQIIVLQQVVDDYDHLKESNGRLQLEYQRSLQDILEARKERSTMDQKLNAAKNQIQELEIQMRQCSHEKMGSMSEMRAMKNVFEQERKNMRERYERTIQKLEAELSYAKKTYQETKRRYRELQIKFEQDQPAYQKLKEQLDSERDAFQAKLNDVVIGHVTNLDLISKQSNVAIENTKWIQKEQETIDSKNDISIQFINKSDESQMITTDMNTPSQGRRMTAIWEPNQ